MKILQNVALACVSIGRTGNLNMIEPPLKKEKKRKKCQQFFFSVDAISHYEQLCALLESESDRNVVNLRINELKEKRNKEDAKGLCKKKKIQLT